MGISYQVRIRCLRVIDLRKVNVHVLHAEESVTWKDRLKAYYDELNPNVESIQYCYKHETTHKSYYTMANLQIPYWYSSQSRPNVLAFSNNALDRRGNTLYTTVFYDTEGSVVEKIKNISPHEENRFMIHVPKEAYSSG